MFYLQSIVKFYQEHNTLILDGSRLITAIVTLITALLGLFWWLKRRHRQRKIPPDIFPFDQIPSQCRDLKKRILGGANNDPLADRNIKYQQRVENHNTKRELQRLLSEHRWVLIVGGTGIGKTREAVEVAEYFNQQGWTVLYLKPNQWLDIPPRMPEQVGTDRKLLFLIDDLNQKMHRSRQEISPEAEKSPVENFTVPLQERLLDTLERYEYFCGQQEMRVIATARNEKQSYFPQEPSPWEQLQWEKYPKLWQKFHCYELPAPSNNAIVEMLAATVTSANIQSKPEDYLELASRNDSTFRNVVENLRRCNVDRLDLTPKNYQDSLIGSWEKRYQNAVERYPASEYVYDAMDLLQQFGIVLQRFTVEPTARIIAGGNYWQWLKNYWQIRKATNFLTDAANFLIDEEGNLQPRDGQIEGKGYQVNAGEFVSPLLGLMLKLADKHGEQILGSLFNFGYNLGDLGFFEKAIASYDKAIEIKPDYHQAWYNRGNALFRLGRNEEAIASYDKAIEIKPDDDQAWNNRGVSLGKLGRNEEAIASWDKAIEIKPDYHQAWNNRGNALGNLGRYEEAIASWDKAIEIKPDLDEAWYNQACAYSLLNDIDTAIEKLQEAINLNPEYKEMAKTDSDFDAIRDDQRFVKIIGNS